MLKLVEASEESPALKRLRLATVEPVDPFPFQELVSDVRHLIAVDYTTVLSKYMLSQTSKEYYGLLREYSDYIELPHRIGKEIGRYGYLNCLRELIEEGWSKALCKVFAALIVGAVSGNQLDIIRNIQTHSSHYKYQFQCFNNPGTDSYLKIGHEIITGYTDYPYRYSEPSNVLQAFAKELGKKCSISDCLRFREVFKSVIPEALDNDLGFKGPLCKGAAMVGNFEFIDWYPPDEAWRYVTYLAFTAACRGHWRFVLALGERFEIEVKVLVNGIRQFSRKDMSMKPKVLKSVIKSLHCLEFPCEPKEIASLAAGLGGEALELLLDFGPLPYSQIFEKLFGEGEIAEIIGTLFRGGNYEIVADLVTNQPSRVSHVNKWLQQNIFFVFPPGYYKPRQKRYDSFILRQLNFLKLLASWNAEIPEFAMIIDKNEIDMSWYASSKNTIQLVSYVLDQGHKITFDALHFMMSTHSPKRLRTKWVGILPKYLAKFLGDLLPNQKAFLLERVGELKKSAAVSHMANFLHYLFNLSIRLGHRIAFYKAMVDGGLSFRGEEFHCPLFSILSATHLRGLALFEEMSGLVGLIFAPICIETRLELFSQLIDFEHPKAFDLFSVPYIYPLDQEYYALLFKQLIQEEDFERFIPNFDFYLNELGSRKLGLDESTFVNIAFDLLRHSARTRILELFVDRGLVSEELFRREIDDPTTLLC